VKNRKTFSQNKWFLSFSKAFNFVYESNRQLWEKRSSRDSYSLNTVLCTCGRKSKFLIELLVRPKNRYIKINAWIYTLYLHNSWYIQTSFICSIHSESTILADLRYTLSSWCKCCTIIISDYIIQLLTTINLVKQAGRPEPPQAKIDEGIHSTVPLLHLGVGPAIWWMLFRVAILLCNKACTN